MSSKLCFMAIQNTCFFTASLHNARGFTIKQQTIHPDRPAQDNAGGVPPTMCLPPAILQLQLPCLKAISPHKCHPDYESIRDECDEWSLSLFDPPLHINGAASRTDDPTRVAYIKGLYPLGTAISYPGAPCSRRLVLIAKLITWLIMMDDVIDHADPSTASNILQLAKAVLVSPSISAPRIMTDPHHAKLVGKAHYVTLVERFRLDVWAEMRLGMSPTFRAHFIRHMFRTLDAFEAGRAWRVKPSAAGQDAPHVVPEYSWDSLMLQRVADSFAMPCLLLIQYGLGIELLDRVGEDEYGVGTYRQEYGPLLSELERVAIKHFVLVNDVFSCGKELASNDTLSAVGFLVRQRGIDVSDITSHGPVVQEVIDKVWGMVQEQEGICARILRQLNAQSSSSSPHAQRLIYADAVCSLMAGHMYWCTVTARYRGHESPVGATTPLTIPVANATDLNILRTL